LFTLQPPSLNTRLIQKHPLLLFIEHLENYAKSIDRSINGLFSYLDYMLIFNWSK